MESSHLLEMDTKPPSSETPPVAVKGAEPKGKGFALTSRILCLAAIIVVLLLIVTVVIAVQFTKKGGSGATTRVTPVSTAEPSAVPSAEPTSHGPGPFHNIRLPRNVIPIAYDVALDVNMANFSFTGKTKIDINVTSSDSTYVLVHVANMWSVVATMKDNSGNDVPIKRQFEFKKNQFYVLEFVEAVKKGLYSLHFEHSSPLANDLKGFYRSSYTYQGKENLVAATQFQPTDCRRAFPAFDEPALKALFSITLIHEAKYLALTNMPLSSTGTKDGRTTDVFQKSIRMPTYLLAFVIGEFGEKKNTVGNVSMSYFAPNHQVDQLDESIRFGTQILPHFEEFFKTPYPLPKADMIAVPDFAAGAMENWGLILYRETALLYKEGESSEKNKQRIAIVVSHELAHMWFGNYVTMEWWSDLWLNEGFASFVEYIGVDKVEPSWKMMDQFIIFDQDRALGLDALVTSHPVYVEVKSPDQINEIFDTISYSKGSAILRMLSDFLGMDTFKEGLKGYLSKYALSNAKTNDLWDSLGMVTKGKYDVGKIMDTWTRQMGFPVVNVKRTATGFKLTQKRFLADKFADPSKAKYNSTFGYLWYVPFQYETFTADGTSEGTKLVWMNLTKEATFVANTGSKLLKGNAGQNGFFRVNYEPAEWTQISNALKNNHTTFSVADRAGLIGDAFSLAGAGLVPYSTALDVFDYMEKETDYVPWSIANSKIRYIASLLSKTSKAYKQFKTLMLHKVTPRYDEVDFNKDVTDQLTLFKQGIIISSACRYGIQSCLGNTSKMFSDWMASGKSVDPNLRSLVYYYGIRNGGVKEWDFAFKKAMESTVASERINLLYGLSATQEPWLINRYLKYSLNSSYVKSQDASRVFSYICGSGPLGSSSCWNYFKAQWSKIKSQFGGGFFSMRSFIVGVSGSFSTQYELDEFDQFFSSAGDLGTAANAVNQARESIKARMQWLELYESDVATWLEKNYQ